MSESEDEEAPKKPTFHAQVAFKGGHKSDDTDDE